MNNFETFLMMLNAANVKHKVRGVKKTSNKKVVVFGRFSCEQMNFYFDNDGNLIKVGSFEEPFVHWHKEHGKFLLNKSVRNPNKMSDEQYKIFEDLFKGHPTLKKVVE